MEDILSKLKQKKTVIIGRPGKDVCDVEFHDQAVSRPHCKLQQLQNGSILLTDLNSKNHTFVNGKPLINDTTEINLEDVIIVGNQVFSLKVGCQNRLLAISAKNIEKKFANDVIGVRDTSVHIIEGDFVAIMGPSGCGKSTLLKLLSGADPATSGEVSIFGTDLYKNYSSIKGLIGYVPQDDIVHKELTVEKALKYAFKLRTKESWANELINRKINEVLEKLNLKDERIKKSKVADLSGGQRKRISIAIELLSDPKILFLDEPTSPLDPETIEEFLNCLKDLSDTGMTIIMVTHKPEDLNYANSVIWMGNGGYLVYQGAKNDYIGHFGKNNVIEVYSYLYDQNNARESHGKWQPHSTAKAQEATPIEKSVEYPLFKQYLLLTMRYLEIKLNDVGYMSLLLIQGPLIAILIGMIFDRFTLSVLFMINLTALWFGANNAAREIVGELSIYKRERMYNLRLLPYVTSKLTVLSLFSIVQVFLFISILYLFYSGNETGMSNYLMHIVMMTFMTFSATLAGLLLSGMVKTSEQAIAVLPLLLIPQIVFSGVIYPIDHSPIIEFFSFFSLGRQGTDAFSVIQGSIEHLLPLCVSTAENIAVPDMKYGITQAKEALALPDTLGIPSGSFVSSISVLSAICAIMFGSILFVIKKKDKL